MRQAHSSQNKIAARVFLMMVPCIAFANCFSTGYAQTELRPQITGTATTQNANGAVTPQANTRPSTGQPTAGTTKLPLAVIVNEQVDMAVDSSNAAPSKKMRAVRVKVSNRSDAPLILDGDHSFVSAQSGGQVIARCISQNQMDAVGRPPTTFTGKLSSDLKATVTAAASVGIVQTAETIKREVGPIEKRYEYDHERQVNEESRFGRRLVYPGDSTTGKIYFNINVPLEDGMLLELPIKSFYDNSAEATLGKPIRITTEGNRQ